MYYFQLDGAAIITTSPAAQHAGATTPNTAPAAQPRAGVAALAKGISRGHGRDRTPAFPYTRAGSPRTYTFPLGAGGRLVTAHRRETIGITGANYVC